MLDFSTPKIKKIEKPENKPEKIAVIDIETTGLDNKKECIIEIGICELDLQTGNIVKLFEKLIREDSFNISHKNCWTFKNLDFTFDQIIKDGIPLDNFREELQNIFNKYICTAYNSKFDFGFLESRGFKIPNKTKDPMLLATDILKQPSSRGGYKYPKCQDCLDYFKIEEKEPHRAYKDSELEAKIILKLKEIGVW